VRILLLFCTREQQLALNINSDSDGTFISKLMNNGNNVWGRGGGRREVGE